MNTNLLEEIERLKAVTWEDLKRAVETKNTSTLDPLRAQIADLEEMGRDMRRISAAILELSQKSRSSPSGNEVVSFSGRRIRVQVTQGMISQNLLTLTQAKKRGLVRRGERFAVRSEPNGETFETSLMGVGNRLQERGAIARFYQAAGVEADDMVELVEEAPNQWELKLAQKAAAAFDQFKA